MGPPRGSVGVKGIRSWVGEDGRVNMVYQLGLGPEKRRPHRRRRWGRARTSPNSPLSTAPDAGLGGLLRLESPPRRDRADPEPCAIRNLVKKLGQAAAVLGADLEGDGVPNPYPYVFTL